MHTYFIGNVLLILLIKFVFTFSKIVNNFKYEVSLNVRIVE